MEKIGTIIRTQSPAVGDFAIHESLYNVGLRGFVELIEEDMKMLNGYYIVLKIENSEYR